MGEGQSSSVSFLSFHSHAFGMTHAAILHLTVDLNKANQQKHWGKVVNWHLCTNHKPTMNDLCDPVEPPLMQTVCLEISVVEIITVTYPQCA